MTTSHERDAMTCRACGNEERASEGYPCTSCGTFICVICSMKGITICRKCAAADGAPNAGPPNAGPPNAGPPLAR